MKPLDLASTSEVRKLLRIGDQYEQQLAYNELISRREEREWMYGNYRERRPLSGDRGCNSVGFVPL